MKRYLAFSFFSYSLGSVLFFSEYFRGYPVVPYSLILIPPLTAFFLHIGDIEYRTRTILVFSLLIALALPSVLLNLENVFQIADLVLLFILVNLIGIDPKSFRKSSILGITLGILTVLLTVITGMVRFRFYTDALGRFRAYMGFINPNSLSLFTFALASLILYTSHSFTKILISFFLVAMDYLLTGSRTIAFIFGLMVSIYALFKLGLSRRLIINAFIVLLIIFIVFEFSIPGIPFRYPYGVLNSLLSKRLDFAGEALNHFGLENVLFGGIEREGLVLDSSYLRFTVFYGYPFLIAFLVSVAFSINTGTSKDPMKASFIISVMFYSLFEGVVDTPVTVVSALWWFEVLNSHAQTGSHEIDHVLGGHEKRHPAYGLREELHGKVDPG